MTKERDQEILKTAAKFLDQCEELEALEKQSSAIRERREEARKKKELLEKELQQYVGANVKEECLVFLEKLGPIVILIEHEKPPRVLRAVRGPQAV